MKRNFCLGSEWLYYKIYTGVRTADIVLLEKLQPIIIELKNKNLISQWFFIRYKDIDEHLRIRFLIDDPKNLSKVIAELYPVLNSMLEENLVWKIQTDTYKREIERYGENTMIDSEFLFWQDSEMILDYLKLKPSFINDEIQLLFSFYAVDSFLNSFSLTNLEKLDLMNTLQESFKKEFSADKNVKKELDKQYRELSTAIANLLVGKVQNEFSEMIKIVQDRNYKIADVVVSIKEKLEIPIVAFVMSHIHMMINRQYTSKQRMYELIIYDHLYRYYKMNEYKGKFIS